VKRPSDDTRWTSYSVGNEDYELLNLDHPAVEARILDEMKNGVKVYYDRRWGATAIFGEWLLKNPHWMKGKKILTVGAGVGLETVVLGRHCTHLYVNDLAPISLDLCAEQMRRNNIESFSLLPGSCSEIELPQVDLAVGCFLIYTRETMAAMLTFADRFNGPILLVNENLAYFRKFLAQLERPAEELFFEEGARGILLPER